MIQQIFGRLSSTTKQEFDRDSLDIIANSRIQALIEQGDCIHTKHLLLAMLNNPQSNIAQLLVDKSKNTSANGEDYLESLANVRSIIRRYLDYEVKVIEPIELLEEFEIEALKTGNTQSIYLTKVCERILKLSFLEAKEMKSEYVKPNHILVAILNDHSKFSGLFKGWGIDREVLRKEL